MPSIAIRTPKGWVENPQKLFDAVQAAVTESIGAPAHATQFWLEEFPVSYVRSAPGGGSPRYTEIRVTLYTGRTNEQKQALYAAAKKVLAPFGLAADDVKVILIESPKENWS